MDCKACHRDVMGGCKTDPCECACHIQETFPVHPGDVLVEEDGERWLVAFGHLHYEEKYVGDHRYEYTAEYQIWVFQKEPGSVIQSGGGVAQAALIERSWLTWPQKSLYVVRDGQRVYEGSP